MSPEGSIVVYIIVGAFVFFLFFAITRWILAIDKRNRYLEAQIKLLAKIARRQGVTEEEITEVLSAAK